MQEFTRSLSESTTAQPKVYAIDPGLALANSRAGVNDRGQRLEDAVYLELRRRNPGGREGTISTLRTKGRGLEVDFVVGDILDEAPTQLVQVTESMALWEAMRETGLEEGVLVVGNGLDATHESDFGRIHQVPAWKWLLFS